MLAKTAWLTILCYQVFLVGVGQAADGNNEMPSSSLIQGERQIDLTEVVTVSLVLGFAYAVIQRFRQDE